MKALLLIFIGLVANAQTIIGIRQGAEQNQKILKAIKDGGLNCCDARFEPPCNDLMKPTSSTKGLISFDLFWTDGKKGRFLPLELKEKSPGKFVMKGLGFDNNSAPMEIERTIEIVDGNLVWVGKSGEKFPIKSLTQINLEDATASRPPLIGYIPTACYTQSFLPNLNAWTDKPGKAEFWCRYVSGTVAPTVKVNNVDICYEKAECSKPEPYSPAVEIPVACRAVNGGCPPATYCFVDPTVTLTNGVTELNDVKPASQFPAATFENFRSKGNQ